MDTITKVFANIISIYRKEDIDETDSLQIDEDTVVTGCSDGLIRLLTVQPNKAIGIVGEHIQGLPVEKIDLDVASASLLSLSHSNTIKVWGVKDLLEDNDAEEDVEDEDSDSEGEAVGRDLKKPKSKGTFQAASKGLFSNVAQASRSAFFSDL